MKSKSNFSYRFILSGVLLSLFLVSSNVFSQDAHQCGTYDEVILNFYDKGSKSNNKTTDQSVDWMPVQVYRIVKSDGTPSEHASTDATMLQLLEANEFFINANIQLYAVGPEIVIERDELLLIDNSQEARDMHAEFDDPEVFEIFINDGFTDNGTPESFVGRSYGSFIIDNIQVLSTLIHEIGHSLGLPHTFFYNSNVGPELVTRDPQTQNCEVAGDRICDTQADPNRLPDGQTTGDPFTYQNCQMTSNTRDLNGDLYDPPFDNIMSYYSTACGLNFTPGQYDRMETVYLSVYEGNLNENLNRPDIAGLPTDINHSVIDQHIVLSWNPDPKGIGTLIEFSEDGTNYSYFDAVVGQNSYTLPDYVSGSNYYVRLRHLNSTPNTYSSYTVYTEELIYCLMQQSNQRDTYLSLYGIGGVTIDKAGLANLDSTADYYALYPEDTAYLMPGGTYQLHLDATGFGGNLNSFPTSFVVFLDSDLSGSFEKDEILYRTQPENDSEVNVSVPINIPSDAIVADNARLRVFSKNEYDFELLDGCGEYESPFNVEDYPVRFLDKTIIPQNLTATFRPEANYVELSWDFPGNNEWYVVYESTNEGPFIAIDTINEKTYMDNQFFGGNTYDYKIARLYGDHSVSARVNIPENFSGYCVPTFTSLCELSGNNINAISEIKTGFSIATSECKSYEDSREDTLRVYIGESYTFRVDRGGRSWRDYAVWADFNKNGYYDDDEKLAEGPTNNDEIVSIDINIPEEIADGNTSLRFLVYSLFNDETMTPCGEAVDGQAEDITLEIIKVNPQNVPDNLQASFSDSENAVNLTWDFAEPEADFVIYRSYDNENFLPVDTVKVDGFNFQYKDTIFFSGGEAYYKVAQLYNSLSDAASLIIPEGESFYCTPSFINPCNFNGLSVNRIEEPTTGFLVESGGCRPYDNSMGDTLKVYTGQDYTLKVNRGGWSTTSMSLWVDFNKNAVYEPGEKVDADLIADLDNTLQLSIPDSVDNGITHLRVLVWIYSEEEDMKACGTASDGQAEDITLNIIKVDPAVTPENLSATFSEPLEAVKLSWDYDITGSDFVIYKSSDMVNYQPYDTVYFTGSEYEYYDSVFFSGNTVGYRVGQLYNNSTSNVSITIPEGFSGYCKPNFVNECRLTGMGVNALSEKNTGFSVATPGCEGYQKSQEDTLMVYNGAQYNFTLDGGTWSGTFYGLWADFNRNGEFEMEEKIAEGETNFTIVRNILMDVPVDAEGGISSLRAMVWNRPETDPMTACGTASTGQAEDVVLKIIPILPENVPINVSAEYEPTDESVFLTWDFPSGSSDFIIYRSDDLFNYEPIDTVFRYSGAFNYRDTLIRVGNKTFGYKVAQIYNILSDAATVNVPEIEVTYCTPDFRNACDLETYGVNSIEVASENFLVSTPGCGSYTDSREFTLSVSAGNTYSIEIITGLSTTYGIWADFDQNGFFDTNELLADGSASFIAEDITIPEAALSGKTVLRVKTWWIGNADPMTVCSGAMFGQVEDISLSISDGLDPAPSNLQASFIANSLELTWDLEDNTSPDEVVVESSTDGINFNEVARLDGNLTNYLENDFQTSTNVVFRVYTLSGGVSSSYSNLAVVQPIITGISDFDVESLMLYPNPSLDGIFNIKAGNQSAICTMVTSPAGPVTEGWKYENNTLDLSQLSSGLYFVHLKVGDSFIVSKVTVL